ncbi:MAG TPA: hypothetical protein PK289_07040 [Bacteroidia bacterium]|nr:hypothetical protein [Bacteroidia bacterium]
MMKKLLLLLIIIFSLSNSYSQTPTKPPSGKGNIIGGIVVDGIGTGLIVYAVMVSKDPVYNYIPDGKRTRRNRSIGFGAVGVGCLVLGTLNISKGVKLYKNRNVDLTLNGNEVFFVYRF